MNSTIGACKRNTENIQQLTIVQNKLHTYTLCRGKSGVSKNSHNILQKYTQENQRENITQKHDLGDMSGEYTNEGS